MAVNRPWPPGVEPRQRRPASADIGPALIAALIGGFLAGGRGAAVGGLAGLALDSTSKSSLDNAFRQEVSRRGVTLVSFYRPARNRAEAVINVQGQYRSLESTCPYQLEQEDMDDWLFGDLVQSIDTLRLGLAS